MLQPKLFFDEIVGLRIYLALWVAVGHALQMSGFLEPSNPLLGILLNGHAAVVVFMIVSGFVITNLLLVKQEGYGRYITRRFFRLFPAYVFCCVVGYFLADDWARLMPAVSWANSTGWQAYAASVYEIYDEVTLNVWPHLALHAVMLHGAIPDQILNRAAMTFLPAAWSISLEWQFYLVAPLVIAATRKGWQIAVVALVALVAYVAYTRGLLGAYDIGSSIAGASQYFLIGIVSRLAFTPLTRLSLSPLGMSVLAVFVAVALCDDALPLIVWGVFYCYLLWHRNAPLTGPVFKAVTTVPIIQLLGEASYSLYLIHRPAQIALASLLLPFATSSQFAMLAVQLGAVLLALPVSILMYRFIEKPGVRIGHRLAGLVPEKVEHPTPR